VLSLPVLLTLLGKAGLVLAAGAAEERPQIRDRSRLLLPRW
jgi:hypothetical protein